MGVLAIVHLLLQQYGYAALVLILFLDSIGVPWPTEATLVVTGAAAQVRQLPLLWAASVSGSTLGSSLSYYLGKRMGPSLMQRIARVLRLTPEQLDRVDGWFAKHGHRAVFFGRLVPFVRNLAGFPAGVIGMPFGQYLAYSMAGYGVYIGIALGLGYGGSSLARLLGGLEILLWILAPVALLVVYLKWGRAWMAKRRGRG